ncbi:MAG: hypothetical protein ACLQU1_36260 [Bryobacteraceae bacterium]
MSRFLQFVVQRSLEGRSAELKETVIATEVFGRPADYNPKRDAIVRTEAGRLRARLGEYYLAEGANDPLVIELPRGGYVPAFRLSQVDSPATPPAPRRFPFRLAAAVAGAVLLSGGIGWWAFWRNAPISVAVLPIENISHDPANDYLADGLTDELIRTLAAFDGLAVRSRTSSFALKGKSRNIRESGRELSADYIVEGSILRAGDTLRINAQLIRVRDDFSLWSGRFERNVSDILSVQDGIARAIAGNLPIKLGRQRKRSEVNPEAYDLYLKARAAGLHDSAGLFQDSIAKDPSFAPAYAGLAEAYAYVSSTNNGDPIGQLPKMRAAAEKAVQLDPSLADAHASLGMVYAREGNWMAAEKSFRKAIQLNPSRSESYADYCVYVLMQGGRIREALQEMRIAEKFDPLSPEVRSELAYVLLSSHLYDEAAMECQKLPEDCHCWPAPREPVRYECLGRARLGQGRLKEGMEILAAGVAKGVPIGAPMRGYLGYAYGLLGRRDEAQKIIDDDWRNPYHQALTYIGLGDKTRAIEAVQRTANQGPLRVGLALAVPELDSIRDDPRIKALRKQLGLP